MERRSLVGRLRRTDLLRPRAEARASGGWDAWVRWMTGVGLLLSLTIIFTFMKAGTLPSKGLSVGDVAPRDIKAGEEFLVEDEASTAKNKREAEEAVRDVYDLDRRLAGGEIAQKVRAAFSEVKRGYEAGSPERKASPPSERPSAKPEGGPTPETKRPEEDFERTQAFLSLEDAFYKGLGLQPEATLVAYLRGQKYDPKIGEEVARLLEEAMAPGVVSNKKLLLAQVKRGIQVREVGSTREVGVEDVERYPDTSDALRGLEGLATRLGVGASLGDRRMRVLLAGRLLQPNLTLNKQATEERRKEAREKAKPVYFQIKKGEMIVREGERLTPEHMVKLRGLAALQEKRGVLAYGVGIALLMALFLALTWIYLTWFKAKLIRSTPTVILMAVLLLGTVLIISLFIQLAHTLSGGSGFIEATSYYYAIPFATGAMLAAILVDLEVALLFSALTAFLVGIFIPEGISYPLVALVGSLVASFRVNQYRRRSSILVTGLLVGASNFAVLVPLHLMEGSLNAPRGLFDLLMGIAGGGAVAIVVSASLPLLESLFKVTSNIKLLELGDLNHPILRQLVVQAPGTYHHSVIVGNLAEEAAAVIGGNPLLARVSAYYHDIGKILKPEYFIENQSGPENKHDRLAPRMSSLILISHVKDGIELARRHGLPEKIIDFIPQHHGTSLIPYFYNKAKEREDPGHEAVKEEDFRYPGPRPQTKETAIVLLADVVEAASRTLTDPTPARIQSMVKETISRVFADGQLEECDLTLRDLNGIAEAFVRILTGIFHHRVEYPGQRKAWGQEKPADDDSADRPTEEAGHRPGLDRREGAKALRDLGLSG